MSYAIGIDIGGTKVKRVSIAPSGELLSDDQLETRDAERTWTDHVKRHIAELEQSRGPAAWIGIASPGMAAAGGRSIAWMRGRMEMVQGLDWTTFLGRRRPVPVLNDAHAALIGESWRGAAAGCRNAVLLTLGTGVGGGIICDGKLLRGHLGRAGHLGHLSLDPNARPDIVNTPGSLEDAIGDHTVAARSGGRFTSTRELVTAFVAGDTHAGEIWLRSLKALAAAIASIINTVDPEVVVIGGGIARAGAALFGPLAEYMDAFEWRPHGARVRIVPAMLDDRAGAIGAARHAMVLDSGEVQTKECT